MDDRCDCVLFADDLDVAGLRPLKVARVTAKKVIDFAPDKWGRRRENVPQGYWSSRIVDCFKWNALRDARESLSRSAICSSYSDCSSD